MYIYKYVFPFFVEMAIPTSSKVEAAIPTSSKVEVTIPISSKGVGGHPPSLEILQNMIAICAEIDELLDAYIGSLKKPNKEYIYIYIGAYI